MQITGTKVLKGTACLALLAFTTLCGILSYSNAVLIKDRDAVAQTQKEFSQAQEQMKRRNQILGQMIKDLSDLRDPKVDGVLAKYK